MYVLLNRENIVVDILNEVRYVKLQSDASYVIACEEKQGTGVIGSDCNTHYPLISADNTNSINAVRVMQFDELPENCKPLYWVYNQETESLEERYTTGAEKRENAYEVDAIIEWQGEQLTVDGANKLWQAYTAEGKVSTAQELTAKIAEAKAQIRKEYPDEV